MPEDHAVDCLCGGLTHLYALYISAALVAPDQGFGLSPWRGVEATENSCNIVVRSVGDRRQRHDRGAIHMRCT